MTTETKNETRITYRVESIDGRASDAYGYQAWNWLDKDEAIDVAQKMITRIINWHAFRQDASSEMDIPFVLRGSDGRSIIGMCEHDPNFTGYSESRTSWEFRRNLPLRVKREVVFRSTPHKGDGYCLSIRNTKTGELQTRLQSWEDWQVKKLARELNALADYFSPSEDEIDATISWVREVTEYDPCDQSYQPAEHEEYSEDGGEDVEP